MIINIIIGYLLIGWLDFVITEYAVCRRIIPDYETTEELTDRQVYIKLPELNNWQHDVLVSSVLIVTTLFIVVAWPYAVYKDYISPCSRIIFRK